MDAVSEKKIYITTNYAQFQKLKGNRDVGENRVKKILSSIKKVGYITSPVIVNEKFEVIDGQGRVEAFKRINLPVEYIVHEGAGLKDCIAMNVNDTPWNMNDYIESNIHQDENPNKQDYILLKNVYEANKFLPLSVVCTILWDCYVYSADKEIKAGTFKVQSNDYPRLLRTMFEFVNVCRPRVITPSNWWYAILAIIKDDYCDIDRLLENLNNYGGAIQAKGSDRYSAMQYFEDVYNYSRRKRTYFFNSYVEKMDNIREGFNAEKV